MIHKVKCFKTYQYVTIGNKNSSHFEKGGAYNIEDITYNDEFAFISIKTPGNIRNVPLTNVQFFDLEQEEVSIDRPKQNRVRGNRTGTEAASLGE